MTKDKEKKSDRDESVGCDKCNGVGIIEIKDKAYECQCSLLRRLTKAIPYYVRSVVVRKEHATHPATTMANKSLHIRGSWYEARAIVKVMLYKHPNLYFRITNDAEIKTVAVGQSKDTTGAIIYHSIQDLVESPELLIVQLNQLKSSNKMAGGYLYEALNHRANEERPTWVINTTESPYMQGSFTWHPDVNDLLKTFYLVDLTKMGSYGQEEPEAYIQQTTLISNEQKQVVQQQPKPKPARVVAPVAVKSKVIEDVTPVNEELEESVPLTDDELRAKRLGNIGAGIKPKWGKR